MLSGGCKSSEKFPLTRLNLAVLDFATLSHKRAFTPVFDGLWGEG